MSPEKLDDAISERFPGCMKGRTMYLVPFSMGPIGGPLSKNGIELTDSAYVAVSMRVMTRVSSVVLDCIGKFRFYFKISPLDDLCAGYVVFYLKLPTLP